MLDIPDDELEWRFSTSGGPGGQHANRTASRAELSFDLAASNTFDGDTKERMLHRLGGRAPGGVLTVTVDDTRSQWRNRQIARARLDEILQEAMRPPPPPRRRSRPSRAARERRLEEKRARGRQKWQRKRPDPDAD
jgi:ribosome-associated protein